MDDLKFEVKGDYLLHNPKNEKKADYIYAVLSVDEDGNEGICCMPQIGQVLPAVTLKTSILDVMFDKIYDINEELNTGKKILKAKFKREEL